MIDDDDESNIGMPSTEWMVEAIKNDPKFAEFVKENLAKSPFSICNGKV